MSYKAINGWTKARMKEQIRAKNDGSKARDELGCCYMTPDGNRCAVGCFIPDDNEVALDYAGAVSYLLRYCPDLKDVLPLELSGLLAMQIVHDDVNPDLDVREIYGDVNVCGHDYDCVDVLKVVDEVTYDCGFADYTDADDLNAAIDEYEDENEEEE